MKIWPNFEFYFQPPISSIKEFGHPDLDLSKWTISVSAYVRRVDEDGKYWLLPIDVAFKSYEKPEFDDMYELFEKFNVYSYRVCLFAIPNAWPGAILDSNSDESEEDRIKKNILL